jgi:uncharacterized protein (DUF1778 family)
MDARASARKRSQRLELRTTREEQELIRRAVAATGREVTEFVVSHACEAAARVLADREWFELSPEASSAWEKINGRRGRVLPGLRGLMRRKSPFRG